MYNAPLLGNAFATVTASWGTCRGHDRMRPPKFHPNRSIDYRQIIAFPTVCNMAFVCHLEWQTDAIRILLFWTTHEVNYAVRLSCQNLVSIRYSPPEILRFYNFATLPGKCLTTPPFWGFLGVLNPVILWVVTQTPKRHILGDDASFKP